MTSDACRNETAAHNRMIRDLDAKLYMVRLMRADREYALDRHIADAARTGADQ